MDEQDEKIRAARERALEANPINVGDFITFADGVTRRVSYVWTWPDDGDPVKCDSCGDESNSEPDLPCGRSLGLDEYGEETLPPFCTGRYRKRYNRPQQIQTSAGGSYYLGDGYVSFSGALFRSVPFSTLTDTGDRHDGDVWFFHHDYHTAHNGIAARVKFRVWRCSEAAPE